MQTKWRGVFAIPPTPFTDQNQLDEDGLRACVRFMIECGAHGVVAPVNASEFMYLRDEERRRVNEIVIETVEGRIPVVIGVTDACKELAVELALGAEALGADAIMAMPPHVQKATGEEIRAFYEALDGAVNIPIFIQNYGGPGGTPMSPAFMSDLLRDLEHVNFVKEETELSSQWIGDLIRLSGDRLHGVMGGKAGRHLLDEFRRGVCGTMPACEICDVHVLLWNALEAGDWQRARQIYDQALPLLLFEMTYGVAVYKEVLRRRGVIRSAAFRQVGGKQLDADALAELDDILRDLEPLMTLYPLEEKKAR